MTDSHSSETTERHPLGLEPGFLLRLRTWRDALPWLCVGDALRPATSVLSWLVVAVAVSLTLLLENFLTGPNGWVPGAYAETSYAHPALEQTIASLDAWIGGVLSMLVPPWAEFLARPSSFQNFGLHAVHFFCLALIWLAPGGYLMRQAALSAAGRATTGLVETVRLTISRGPAFLSVLVVPWLVMLACWVYFWLVDWLGTLPVAGSWIAGIFGILGLPLALAAGIIGFGSCFAIPMAWAAISIEREGNGFDGISRGYEYVLRRPLQLIGYLTIACLILAVLHGLAVGVTEFALAAMQHGANQSTPNQWSTTIISHIPTVVAFTAGWCLVSWLYLLLRRSANHQEIEDVWEPARPAASPLPSLPPEAQ